MHPAMAYHFRPMATGQHLSSISTPLTESTMPAEQELTDSEAMMFLQIQASQAVGVGMKEPTPTDNVEQSEVTDVADDYDNARSQSPNVLHETSNLSRPPNAIGHQPNLSPPPNAVVDDKNFSEAQWEQSILRAAVTVTEWQNNTVADSVER